MKHPLILNRPITFFDVETTSAVVDSARIVQIALIRIEENGDVAHWHSLINPGEPIEPGATEVHGISDEDVAFAPSFRDAARPICELLRGADLGGFNATGFDVPILDAELKRAGLAGGLDDRRIRPEGRVVVDAYDLEIALNPRTLEALFERYTGAPLEESHDALADVTATLELLATQIRAHAIEEPAPAALQQLARGDYLDAKRRFLLRDDGEIVVSFGKHNGRTLRSLLEVDPGYVRWMCDELGAEVVEIATSCKRQYAKEAA